MSSTLVYLLYTEDSEMGYPDAGTIAQGGFEKDGQPWIKAPANISSDPFLCGHERAGTPWVVNPIAIGVDGLIGLGAVDGVTKPLGVDGVVKV